MGKVKNTFQENNIERIDFYKAKWLKEHISIMVFIGICIIGVALLGIVCKQGWIISIAIFLLLVAHGWRNNTMMAYVEKLSEREDVKELSVRIEERLQKALEADKQLMDFYGQLTAKSIR